MIPPNFEADTLLIDGKAYTIAEIKGMAEDCMESDPWDWMALATVEIISELVRYMELEWRSRS